MTHDEIQKVRGALVAADNAILSVHGYNEALAILDAELAKPAPYAVARVDDLERGGRVRALALKLSLDAPLYTAPPAAKQWVGLTNEEVVYTTFKTENEYCTPGWCMDFARAIEAALRAKNSGEQNG